MKAGTEGMFGGIRYEGCEGLTPEERREYRRAMKLYVAQHSNHPAYQRSDGNSARQALAIERDLRTLVHGRVLALVPKPELAEEAQSVLYTVRHLGSPKEALDLVLHRAVSRSITKVLAAAPALVPMAVAVLVAKEVLGFMSELSLSDQEKAKELEDEHRHDREQQFLQANQHDYERER